MLIMLLTVLDDKGEQQQKKFNAVVGGTLKVT
jgi:hypothetical protein